MALPDIKEARQLSDSELADEIVAAKRKLFELRFQKATRQLEKEFHQFKHLRHRVAQLMTVQRERQLAADKPAASTEQTAADTTSDS